MTSINTLILVESHSKAMTIQKFLGSNYTVIATHGHIMDLPKDRMAVNVANQFETEFVVQSQKKALLTKIKKLSKEVDLIYVGTDPDREGEAIAGHILEILANSKNRSKIHRILFHEVTKPAILKAIQNPLKFDKNKIEAQLSRRIIDRITGYTISPILWKTSTGGVSAGRVQSVVLKWICERELEIQNFVKQEYWKVYMKTIDKNKFPIILDLNLIDNEPVDIKTKVQAESIIKKYNTKKPFEVLVDSVSKKVVARHQPFPLTTSSLQQEAIRRFGYSSKKVMEIATSLYEGVSVNNQRTGLVTYIRTDSTRISPIADQKCKEYIQKIFGQEYISPNIFQKKSKNKIQDAHEAIRPTDVFRTPESISKYLSKDEFNVYNLIWNQFIASRMKEETVCNTHLLVKLDNLSFLVSDTKTIDLGYKSLPFFQTTQKQLIPENIQKGDTLTVIDFQLEQKFTEPPPRYTENKVIEKLEKTGVGRPSTYTAILQVLYKRKYIVKEKKTIHPTQIGLNVNHFMVTNFEDFVRDNYTARMEEKLDDMEKGELHKLDFLNEFYKEFIQIVKKVKLTSKTPSNTTPSNLDRCPECNNGTLQNKFTKAKKKYKICSRFPDCSYMKYV